MREYENDATHNIQIHNHRNTVAVEISIRGEKMGKVMGSLAMQKPVEGVRVSGILVKRNFKVSYEVSRGKYT